MITNKESNVEDHFGVHIVCFDRLQAKLEVTFTNYTNNSSVSHIVVNVNQLIGC